MQISEIFTSLRKSGWGNTMMTSDFRLDVEMCRFAHAQWKICIITFINGGITKIPTFYRKWGLSYTIMTSDFRLSVVLLFALFNLSVTCWWIMIFRTLCLYTHTCVADRQFRGLCYLSTTTWFSSLTVSSFLMSQPHMWRQVTLIVLLTFFYYWWIYWTLKLKVIRENEK